MEWIVSGYCRSQDQARAVLLERDGTQWDCDCDYPDCTYVSSCPVAAELHRKQEETL